MMELTALAHQLIHVTGRERVVEMHRGSNIRFFSCFFSAFCDLSTPGASEEVPSWLQPQAAESLGFAGFASRNLLGSFLRS